jgi:hypothetical protein
MSPLDLPSDLFFLLMIRMDAEMLSTILDDDTQYFGKNAIEFEDFIQSIMAHHKSLGDEKLLALPGKIGHTGQIAYGFIGNKSKKSIGMVVLVNNQKQILGMHKEDEFTFDEFPFDLNSF